jgi:hypothetical protein
VLTFVLCEGNVLVKANDETPFLATYSSFASNMKAFLKQTLPIPNFKCLKNSSLHSLVVDRPHRSP